MSVRLSRTAPPPAAEPGVAPSARLRSLVESSGLEFLMEAHDGLSAKIVEQAGFRGIWASGLSMSAALGVRDSNEASWTQVLEILEFMADATSLPILVDGDTGWGNFNNVRRAVRKLCERGLAGICIEDKLFPKTNSFIDGPQPLADVSEFQGKIRAAKDSQTDPDFVVVARVEALIAGWGLDEALDRAEAYRDAGADAILIHSKRRTADEVLGFAREWGGRSPLVIVPTRYAETPTDVFREAGISVAIWANHTLRAAITGMQEVCRQVRREGSVAGVDRSIVSVQDVFELVGNDELAEAETRYLPVRGTSCRAVVLAASRGQKLGRLTADRPKCMLDIRGQPLLRRLVSSFHSSGVRDVTVVRGYRKEMVNLPSIEVRDNDEYAVTGEAASLARAVDRVQGECVIAYGDVLFRQYILDRLLEQDGDIVLAVDGLWDRRRSPEGASARGPVIRDLVACSRPFSLDYLDDEPAEVRRVGHELVPEEVHGEWIGLLKLSDAGSRAVRRALETMRDDDRLRHASLIEVFGELLRTGEKLSVLWVTGHWLDVDDAYDLERAREFP